MSTQTNQANRLRATVDRSRNGPALGQRGLHPTVSVLFITAEQRLFHHVVSRDSSAFLNYFKSKGHAIVSSSPVIPHDDPTLLFINAGMNQFKDVFLGKSKREYSRAATTQMCIRVGGKHNDLDNVGHTTRHLTFFEMLGNFSFGDYFKKDAIAYAWEVSTKIFGFDPEKIWLPSTQTTTRRSRFGKSICPPAASSASGEENFWAMATPAPAALARAALRPRRTLRTSAQPEEDASGERYLEFWNLVFMQFSKDASGKMEPLPSSRSTPAPASRGSFRSKWASTRCSKQTSSAPSSRRLSGFQEKNTTLETRRKRPLST